MAIAFRGATGIDVGSSVTSFSVDKPTGTVEGDVILIFVRWEDSASNNATSTGFTEIVSKITNTASEPDFHLWVLRKVAGASEPSSYTVTRTSGSGFAAATAISFSGVDPTTPEDVVGTGNTGSGTTPSANSVTTTSTNTMVVYGYSNPDGTGSTAPTGFTESAGADNGGTLAAYKSFASAGATGAITGSGPNAQWITVLVALREAGGGGGDPEGRLVGGKLVGGGLLISGVLA